VKRLFDFLNRLTAISALPAHVMTYSVVFIWLFGAGGLQSAAGWWHDNAGTTTTFVTLVLGSWLAYKGVGKLKGSGGGSGAKEKEEGEDVASSASG
jgi:hypothetical protein